MPPSEELGGLTLVACRVVVFPASCSEQRSFANTPFGRDRARLPRRSQPISRCIPESRSI